MRSPWSTSGGAEASEIDPLQPWKKGIGLIAHEMAHAYGSLGWRDLILTLSMRAMEKRRELDEAVTDRIANRALVEVKKWSVSQDELAINADSTTMSSFMSAIGAKEHQIYRGYFMNWVGSTPGYRDPTKQDRTGDWPTPSSFVTGAPRRA